MLIRRYVRTQVWRTQMRLRLDDRYGATAVEYALMLACIFAAIVVAVAYLGQQTNSQFSSVHFTSP